MSVAANRYAKALMDVLYPVGAAETGLAELQRFSALLKEQPDAVRALENPTIPAARRQALLKTIGETLGFSQHVRSFLDLLVDRNRLDIIQSILDAYQKMMDDRLGIVRAMVTSAQQLDSASQSQLAMRLESVTGKRVVMQVSVDPSLIGGVVAQVGSTVYDGSIRQQLKTFRNRLANKS
jgi:F-type H+-transporting ATPase subunit delta